MIPEFTWNLEKARENVRKHGISFEEAVTVFGDFDAAIEDDATHSGDEDRFIIVGTSHRERVLLTVYTMRDEIVRIISSRIALRHERRTYEEKKRRV